jgi:hypothetical protein
MDLVREEIEFVRGKGKALQQVMVAPSDQVGCKQEKGAESMVFVSRGFKPK